METENALMGSRGFNAYLAQIIGLNEAIIFNQLDYWFGKVKGRNIRGERWVYITYDQWQEQFPIWSIRTIKNIVKNLRKIGLVTVEMENQLLRSRNSTLHYQIDREHKILKDLGIYTECKSCIPRVQKLHPLQVHTIQKKKNKKIHTPGTQTTNYKSYGKWQRII